MFAQTEITSAFTSTKSVKQLNVSVGY